MCAFLFSSLPGTLNFVTLHSPRTLAVGDNSFSERISTGGAFPFGKESEFYVYVRLVHVCMRII